MIKKLRLKFVLVFLVLVVSVFITSSCYALTADNIEIVSLSDFGITLEDVYDYISSQNSTSSKFPEDFTHGLIADCNSSGTKLNFMFFHNDSNIDYLVYFTKMSYRTIMGYDSDNVIIDKYVFTKVTYNISTSSFSDCYISNMGSIACPANYSGTSGVLKLLDCTTYDIRVNDSNGDLVYEPSQIDTSFDYSLNGKSRGQVELKIDNLDSSLRMYGYVGCENTFNVGDTLDTSSISSYLRLLAIHSDNSDLNCYLYEGEKLLYYIVDENNIILDIGYISELAEGNFLYGFPVNDGVDFVFLNNGQVYWNNELTFKYQVDNGSLLTKNEIVSTGSYSYIESNKTSAKITYNGFVYDSNGDVISSAVTSTTNNLSSLYMKEVNTNYFETKIGLNILIHDEACYWLKSIVLAGTDSSGNDIDFSNYSVRWSIPTWLTLDSIEIGTSSYDKFNGVITGFSSNGVLSIQLKIYELLKNHSKDFDITLEIYNDNGDLVLTYLVNSDDIVRNQILSEENNIDKPSYDITNNPNYTGGSNSYPGSDNIHNWGVDDFANYLGTNNTMFNFFWAFLNNMPTWISTPLTILLIGLVVITLYKFIRG